MPKVITGPNTASAPVSHEDCGLARMLKVIGSKWTLLILRELCDSQEPRRFNELQQALGLSPRTLSMRLKQLEKDKLITKKVFAEVPPHVEYALTEKGRSLKGVIATMRSWGEKY